MKAAVVVVALIVAGCNAADRTPARGASDAEGPAATTEVAQGDVVYVDVRTPGEYAGGHVTGALNIPVEEIEQRWQELEPYRDRPIVLYCRSGRRSGIALRALEARGFSNVENGINLETLAPRGVPVTRSP